jgi:hypothetical protein
VRSNARLDPTVLGPLEYLRRFGNQTPGQPSFIDSLYVAGSPTASAHTYTVATANQDYYQPGDFVRLREISVTYTVPPKLLGLFRDRVTGASVSLAMQNVKLWTRYSGPDPEVISNPSGVGGAFFREDFLTLPNPKQTTLRFDLTF